MNDTETIGQELSMEQVARAQQIRQKLPLQESARALEEAELRYHTVRWGTARREIAKSLPWRWFRRRRTISWAIDRYPHFIPDPALLKFDAASQSGLFYAFYVVEPTYERQQMIRADPWLIGLRQPDSPPFWEETFISIIASWL